MSDTIVKQTPLGCFTIVINIEGDAPSVPPQEVQDLIALLRKTADNLEATMKACKHDSPLMGVSLKVH